MSEYPYSTVLVSGPDSVDFLQSQLTVDMRELADDVTRLAAWCNPKGRVICMLHLSGGGDGIALAMPADLAQAVADRMTMFRFRAQVEFKLRESRASEMTGNEIQAVPVDEWRLTNLKNGVAEIGAAQSERFTPHMLNLDLLGVVSLDKGCYPGQEIVARTHYRGVSKRRMARFKSRTPVPAGGKVSDGNRNVGDVVNVIGTDLLAIVPTDAQELTLYVNEIELTPVAIPKP